MIECSICHVMNEDSARFCAECGQRLVAADSPNPEATTANLQSETSASSLSPAPQPPLATPAAPVTEQAVPQVPAQPAPPPRLRSPLLAGDDEPDLNPSRPERLRPGRQPSSSPKGLRSPLLGGNEDDDEYSDSFDNPPAKSGGLRSPLLGGNDFDDYKNDPPASSHLHSPLLEGDEPRSTFNSGNRPGHLRSPLLGQDYYDEDDFIEEQVTQDNENVLRSPLLQAKVPMSDKQKLNPPTEPEPKISADKAAILQKLEQSKYGSTSAPQNSSAPPVGQTFAQSAFRSPDPFANAGPAPANNWPAITPSPLSPSEPLTPPDRSGPNPWANGRAEEVKSSQASGDSQTNTSYQAANNAPAAPSSSWVDLKPTSLGNSPLSVNPPLTPPVNQTAPQPVTPEPATVPPPPVSKPRLQSKLLSHDNDDAAEARPATATPSVRRFSDSPSFPGPGPEHVGVIQFFVVCLYIAIAMKFWVLFEYAKGGALSPPVLGDELGQIVAMSFLIFLGSVYTKPPSN